MKAFDLLEALTDIQDEDLTDAGQSSKPRHHSRQRTFRYLAAACLTVILVMSVWMVTVANDQDTTMRWTVRYRQQYVTYLCKAQAEWGNALPLYQPMSIPDGYKLERVIEITENRARTFTYRSTEDPRNYISLSYGQVTDRYRQCLYTLPMGSYERHDVTIGTLPGQLYLYTDKRTGGELVWLDVENCMIFHLRFDEGDPTPLLEMAQSVTAKE